MGPDPPPTDCDTRKNEATKNDEPPSPAIRESVVYVSGSNGGGFNIDGSGRRPSFGLGAFSVGCPANRARIIVLDICLLTRRIVHIAETKERGGGIRQPEVVTFSTERWWLLSPRFTTFALRMPTMTSTRYQSFFSGVHTVP